jgi:hypothetical protein
MLSVQNLANALQAKVQAAQPVTAAIYADNEWEPNFNYQFALAQSLDGSAPTDVKFGFLGIPAGFGKGAGGCSCSVSGMPATAATVLPFVLAVVVPLGGIAIGRRRRRSR